MDFLTEIGKHITGLHVKYQPMKVEEWKKQGKPCIWKCCQCSNDVELWEDSGYDYIALFNKNGGLEVGKDYVELDGYVGLSECYTGQCPKLYKEV